LIVINSCSTSSEFGDRVRIDLGENRKQALKTIWDAAIAAVSGQQAVENAIAADTPYQPDLIIAVGKAAVGMCRGALNGLDEPREAIVVTKHDHADDDIRSRERVTVIESGHPIPDQQSLQAGSLLLEKVSDMPDDSRLLVLVSGGASALAEALPEGMSLSDLQSIADEMISTGKTIGEINSRRKQTSLIKDGKLLQQFCGAEIRVYAISDVEGDSISTIGSGIGDCHRATAQASSSIIASNQIARDRAAETAVSLGLEVRLNEESLYDDVFNLAKTVGPLLRDASSGVYIRGGEPTVMLPPNPGRGGRNQSLALALSEYLSGKDNISLLVAGTDGSDGPTTAAGGLVDGNTFNDSEAARQSLIKADAGPYLEFHDSLFVTGPTNTNVMDLAIAIID
jgi:glycerate 2-kinase